MIWRITNIKLFLSPIKIITSSFNHTILPSSHHGGENTMTHCYTLEYSDQTQAWLCQTCWSRETQRKPPRQPGVSGIDDDLNQHNDHVISDDDNLGPDIKPCAVVSDPEFPSSKLIICFRRPFVIVGYDDHHCWFWSWSWYIGLWHQRW